MVFLNNYWPIGHSTRQLLLLQHAFCLFSLPPPATSASNNSAVVCRIEPRMVPCLTLGVCVEHRAQLAPSPLHFPRVPGVAQQQHHQERRPVDCARPNLRSLPVVVRRAMGRLARVFLHQTHPQRPQINPKHPQATCRGSCFAFCTLVTSRQPRSTRHTPRAFVARGK